MRINIKQIFLAMFAGLIFSASLFSQTVSNNAPTLGPVIRAYYDALKKRDDAAIVRVLSAKFLREIKAEMRQERRTHIAAFLAETDYRNDVASIQVRNEIINGDQGVVQVKG